MLKAIGTDVLKGSIAQLILQDFLNLFLKTVDVLFLKELRVRNLLRYPKSRPINGGNYCLSHEAVAELVRAFPIEGRVATSSLVSLAQGAINRVEILLFPPHGPIGEWFKPSLFQSEDYGFKSRWGY